MPISTAWTWPTLIATLACTFLASTAAHGACPAVQVTRANYGADLEQRVTKRLGAGHVKIKVVLRESDWIIASAQPLPDGETGFVFLKPKPGAEPPVWGGSAQPDELQDLKDWAGKNVPGLPAGLARCFARFATGIEH